LILPVNEKFTNRCARPDASDAAEALITLAFGDILFCFEGGLTLGALELSFLSGCTAKPLFRFDLPLDVVPFLESSLGVSILTVFGDFNAVFF